MSLADSLHQRSLPEDQTPCFVREIVTNVLFNFSVLVVVDTDTFVSYSLGYVADHTCLSSRSGTLKEYWQFGTSNSSQEIFEMLLESLSEMKDLVSFLC